MLTFASCTLPLALTRLARARIRLVLPLQSASDVGEIHIFTTNDESFGNRPCVLTQPAKADDSRREASRGFRMPFTRDPTTLDAKLKITFEAEGNRVTVRAAAAPNPRPQPWGRESSSGNPRVASILVTAVWPAKASVTECKVFGLCAIHVGTACMGAACAKPSVPRACHRALQRPPPVHLASPVLGPCSLRVCRRCEMRRSTNSRRRRQRRG
jgi:hypothetical protein